MGKVTGFIEFKRDKQPYRPVAERAARLAAGHAALARRQAPASRARGAWTAASPSAIRAVRSATSSPTGTTSSTGTSGARPSTGCTPPTTSRSSPARCAPRPCEGSCVLGINDDAGHDQGASSSPSSTTPSRQGWIAPEPPEVRTGKTVAVIGSGPAGLAARPAAHARRPLGHRLRARRSDRRAAPLRHPRVQDGEARARPAARARWSAEGVTLRDRRATSASTWPSSELRREVRRAPPRRRRHARRATCRSPGASSAGVHFAMDYLTLQNRRCEGDAVPDDGLHQRRGQARRHHRRRRHRRRLPGHRAPAGRALDPPVRDPARARRSSARRDNPWPQWPNVYRVSSAHEEGGERVYAVSTKRFIGGDRRPRDRPRGRRGRDDATRAAGSASARCRARSSPCPASSSSSRWASSAPSARACWSSSACASPTAATSGATRTG